MKYHPPAALPLTEAEQERYGRIAFGRREISSEVYEESADAACALMHSLLRRDAVSDVRRQYFTDPTLNVGSKQSRAGELETAGARGVEMFRHPQFLPVLRYFIGGPDLPAETVAGFCRILNDGHGPSDAVLERLKEFARAEVRDRRLTPSEAGDEFFKLALELGLDVYQGRAIGDAIRKRR